jgi:hypothetical protein
MNPKNPITLCLQILALTLLLLFVTNKTSAKMESVQPAQHVQVIHTDFNANPPIYLTTR